MTEALFLAPAVERLVRVRAIGIVRECLLGRDSIDDFQQEAWLELWRKRHSFDPQRSTWRTFAERVVANHLASLRTHYHRRLNWESAYAEITPIIVEEDGVAKAADEIRRVIRRLSGLDRRVAGALMARDPTQAAQKLKVSRATIYRSIRRIQTAVRGSAEQRRSVPVRRAA